ncbi:hypothetical protein ACFV0H_28395 [Streptomyces erythrochromogenes]|uniref:hypothetical protein n=1 Tax=Streptomyces erythrochromogenes TaxID=285574 RepID=UPI0036A1F33D
MEHTHVAVGEAEGFTLRLDVRWTPGMSLFDVTVRTAEDLTDHGTYRAVTPEPMPVGTPRDTMLDALAARVLGLFQLFTADWVDDPVSVAAEYVKTTGFQWVTEREARR